MTPVTNENSEIYSVFGVDPDLGELVEMFVDEMPDRVSTLVDAYAAGDSESLQRAAHQMKGAAGSYGFDQLTPLAAALEYSVREGQPEQTVHTLLNELVGACQRCRAGEPS